MTDWAHEYDLVIIGSGGGGMTAALVAKLEGLNPLILEKTDYYGGSTALSGGGVWVPNNHLMAEVGISDSMENARLYMENTVGDRVPKAKQEAYISRAGEMLKYLEKHSHVQFEIMRDYPDYYPEQPGAKTDGRSLLPVIFRGDKLGKTYRKLRPSQYVNQLAFTAYEYKQMAMYKTNPASILTTLRVMLRNLRNNLFREHLVSFGRSLITMLCLSLQERNVPLWLNTAVKNLIVEDGTVVGVEAEQVDKKLNIRANKGVIMAAGGFPRNQKMREQYFPQPVSTEWSAASDGNTGDAINMGMGLDAAVDLMEDAWWGPTTVAFEGSALFLIMERAYPGAIMVNSAGKRFVNESAPYTDVVKAMYDTNTDKAESIPAHFVMDHRFRSNYFLGKLLPGITPKKYYKRGHITKADTIEKLADQLNINPTGLVETIKRFNEFAGTGKDLDFKRGDSVYDQFYADPKVGPNPCLAPVDKPPYYSLRLYPGDIGTKGGLVTNDRAQVLKNDGTVIEGLYAVGNTAASVMGNSYPGAGSTIGPSMTFGYIAAKHVAGKL